MIDIFKKIQTTFQTIFGSILKIKYIKALLFTSVIITFLALYVLLIIAMFKCPFLAAIVVFIPIYIVVLTETDWR